MKNTNKNMMYTFWSGAILLCLALVAVVLVFTNAVGNTGSPKAEATPTVTETPTPQANPISPIQSSAALAQTEDKGSTYVDQIYFLGDKSLKVLQSESMLTGKDAAKQVWIPDTGSLPASSLDTAKYKSPVTGNNVPADEICEVNKPAYLVICPSADNISMTNEEQIKSVYTTLINAVKAKSPDTKIICCSLTPIASNYQYEDITNELDRRGRGEQQREVSRHGQRPRRGRRIPAAVLSGRRRHAPERRGHEGMDGLSAHARLPVTYV